MNLQRTRSAAALLHVVLWWIAGLTSAVASHVQCDPALTQRIPDRRATAAHGSELTARLAPFSEAERDAAISRELLAGNVPRFLRQLVPVTFAAMLDRNRTTTRVTLCVAADYLAVGSDADFLLAPLGLDAALIVANAFGFLLPTTKIVDAIYAHSAVRLRPQPLPASATMRTIGYIWNHNKLIHAQRSTQRAPQDALVAGHKKDVVLTNRLWSDLDRVAIYGWHLGIDRPIQPLSTVHGLRYADYSHGVRLVSRVAYVDGEPRPLTDVLHDPRLGPMLSNEGPLHNVPGLVKTLVARAHAALSLLAPAPAQHAPH